MRVKRKGIGFVVCDRFCVQSEGRLSKRGRKGAMFKGDARTLARGKKKDAFFSEDAKGTSFACDLL